MSIDPAKTKIMTFNFKQIIVLAACLLTANGYAQQEAMTADSMTQKFYAISHHQLYWVSSPKGIKRANQWFAIIESAEKSGFVTKRPQIEQIRLKLSKKHPIDDFQKQQTDKQITGLVLNFLKEWQQGNISFDWDEVNIPRDSLYINQLLSLKAKDDISKTISLLDCKDNNYLILKSFLTDSLTVRDTAKYRAVQIAMNYRRYFASNHSPEYIVVNLPTTTAEYYRNDSLIINMRVVVGKKLTPTPLIASYITSIVTFPYWNVPYGIAVNEILPKVQKNEDYLEQKNFEVVDAKGNIIEDSDLKWKSYTTTNFPYFFRQSTGAQNDLGVLKFNLQNPFSIFLHSTSNQAAFSKSNRFLSHGCIRLEKPFDLAGALLRGNIDLEELKSGKTDEKPKTIMLPQKVPTFIVYDPIKIESGKVIFLPDTYKLIKKG